MRSQKNHINMPRNKLRMHFFEENNQLNILKQHTKNESFLKKIVAIKTKTAIKVRKTILTIYLSLSHSPLFSLLLFMDNSHFFIVTVSDNIHLMESQKRIQ